MQGSGFLYRVGYQTGYYIDFGSGYSPTTHYTCTDVPRTRFASCPTASSTLQITCTNILFSCNIKYDISAYTDYSQCSTAPPPPAPQTTSSSSSSSSSGCQCSCCLGYQCSKSVAGRIPGVGGCRARLLIHVQDRHLTFMRLDAGGWCRKLHPRLMPYSIPIYLPCGRCQWCCIKQLYILKLR